MAVSFDSDNTVFCKDIIDGYTDGYTEEITDHNTITIYGETVDKTNSETLIVTGNKVINGKKLFKSVSKVEGLLHIADIDYEPCVIEILERDVITEPNNDGEYAELSNYSNGTFTVVTAGSNGFYPFELHPGHWNMDYPAFLKINIPKVGDKAYIGSNMSEGEQFGGVIDEFRIISEMSSDTRAVEIYTEGTRSVTRDYLLSDPHCPDDQTLALIHFDNPMHLQSRRLRQKEFLNTESNFKYKLDVEDREKLLKIINDKDKFVSLMMRMGYDEDIALEAYIECHHAQGGALFNETKLARREAFWIGHNSVNENFGLCGRFFGTQPMLVNNRYSYFRKNEGTIEFWISPLLNTDLDKVDRYYVDISSATRKRVKSSTPTRLILPTPANKIVSVKLLQQKQEFSSFYTQDEVDDIFFDEIYRDQKTGRLAGGSGVEKDFSVGAQLSADGKEVILSDALPGSEVDVLITYIPVDFSGDRISVYKNKNSQVVFSIEANGVKHVISKDIKWKRNSWHRVMCTYKTNSTSDTMRLFVDGEEGGYIAYGQNGLIYGNGYIYGQRAKEDGASREVSYNIKLNDDFRLLAIGSDMSEVKSAMSRIDNIRFSRVMRNVTKDPSGEYIDLNYSSNTNTVRPVVSDDASTYLINFDSELDEDLYATVIDPRRGIFNFDIEVIDDFGKIAAEEIEDLIVELVNTLRPAHTSPLVIFPRDPC